MPFTELSVMPCFICSNHWQEIFCNQGKMGLLASHFKVLSAIHAAITLETFRDEVSHHPKKDT